MRRYSVILACLVAASVSACGLISGGLSSSALSPVRLADYPVISSPDPNATPVPLFRSVIDDLTVQADRAKVVIEGSANADVRVAIYLVYEGSISRSIGPGSALVQEFTLSKGRFSRVVTLENEYTVHGWAKIGIGEFWRLEILEYRADGSGGRIANVELS